jgi:uracil-DNA glycosylase
MSKQELLDKLKQEYHNCQRCPLLVQNRTNIVFGVGDPDKCKIVIIGEAPGQQEDLRNEPFVGKSGQLLNTYLNSIGLKREEVYITNTILCRPPDNRNPSTQELKNCSDRLKKHIELLDPKVVITLGNFSTQYVLQTKEGITKLRGKTVEKDGKIILPMQHPAVLLYNGNSPAKQKEFQDDFAVVQQILHTSSPQKKSEKQQKLV